jgi:hypothetical protein
MKLKDMPEEELIKKAKEMLANGAKDIDYKKMYKELLRRLEECIEERDWYEESAEEASDMLEKMW